MGETCSMKGTDQKFIHIFMGLPQRKRPPGSSRSRWDDIKIDLKIVYETLNGIFKWVRESNFVFY